MLCPRPPLLYSRFASLFSFKRRLSSKFLLDLEISLELGWIWLKPWHVLGIFRLFSFERKSVKYTSQDFIECCICVCTSFVYTILLYVYTRYILYILYMVPCVAITATSTYPPLALVKGATEYFNAGVTVGGSGVGKGKRAVSRVDGRTAGTGGKGEIGEGGRRRSRAGGGW